MICWNQGSINFQIFPLIYPFMGVVGEKIANVVYIFCPNFNAVYPFT